MPRLTAKKKKRKTGPKPRPAGELREYRLQIRLNAAEQSTIERLAQLGKQDVSTWARKVLLGEWPE